MFCFIDMTGGGGGVIKNPQFRLHLISLTHQPWQPILSHPPICLHVPWVDKYGAAQLLGCLRGRHKVRSVYLHEGELDLTKQRTVSHLGMHFVHTQVHFQLLELCAIKYACPAIFKVSQHRKGRVQWHLGPSCWYVSQSAPQGSPAPSHSASSPVQPSQELAWAECPGPQTSWGGCALSQPNCHLEGHRDPACHEVWPVIPK